MNVKEQLYQLQGRREQLEAAVRSISMTIREREDELRALRAASEQARGLIDGAQHRMEANATRKAVMQHKLDDAEQQLRAADAHFADLQEQTLQANAAIGEARLTIAQRREQMAELANVFHSTLLARDRAKQAERRGTGRLAALRTAATRERALNASLIGQIPQQYLLDSSRM